MSTFSENKSELNLKTIINNTKFNIFLVDSDLRFIEFNDSFKIEFDFLYNGNLKVGDSAVDAPIPPDMCDDWKRFYKIALSGKKLVQNYEFGNQPYVITLNPVIDKGTVIGIAVFSENMSREYELQRTYEEAHFKHKFAMDVSFSGFWDWNMQTNDVYYSDIWKKMLGYEFNEIENNYQAWERLVHKEDIDFVLNEIKRHLNGETEIYSVEMRLLCKNGQYRWVMAKGKITERKTDGSPLRFVGVHIDIDQLKQTEIDLKKRNEQLREIAYITSHGVRKALANILGLTYIIDPSNISNLENKDLIKKIITSADELNAETNKLAEAIRSLNIELFTFSEKPKSKISSVLIVDDDHINNVITKLFLEKAGIKAVSFVNPVEAFEYLKTNQQKHQLILLDINMPQLNGWDFLLKMQLEKIDTNVIMLTSSIYNSDKEKASGFRNVINYWIKPLTRDKVQSLNEKQA